MNIIVAIDKNKGIGKDNELLAHISPDLKYFKRKTLNKVIVMGYNTYMSLPKRPLPDRLNIVLTTKNIELDGALVVNSLDSLIKKITELENKGNEVFICGGAKIYEQLLPYADKLYITHIMSEFDADTFFPNYEDKFNLTWIYGSKTNLSHKHPHIFTEYTRVTKQKT